MSGFRWAISAALLGCLLSLTVPNSAPHRQQASAAQKERTSQVVRPSCAAFSSDGKLVLVGFTNVWPGADQTHSGKVIKIWDTATRKEVRTLVGHDGGVHRAAFFDNDKKVISSGGDGMFRAWDVETGSGLWTRKTDGWVIGLASEGAHLVSYGKGNIACWKIEQDGLSLRSEYKAPFAEHIVLSPKGAYAFVSGSKRSPEGIVNWTAELLALPEFKLVKRFETGSVKGSLIGLTKPTLFLPHADLAIFGKFDGKESFLVLLQVSAGKEIRALAKQPKRWPRSLAVATNGKTIICRSHEGDLFACDLDSGDELWSLRHKSLERSPVFAFSPDARLAISATGRQYAGQGDLELLLFDTAAGKSLGALSRPVFP
jgi:WD40 repeat protein